MNVVNHDPLPSLIAPEAIRSVNGCTSGPRPTQRPAGAPRRLDCLATALRSMEEAGDVVAADYRCPVESPVERLA